MCVGLRIMSSKKHIYLLVLPQVHLLDLAAPAQIFAHPSLQGSVALHYISPKPEVQAKQGLHLAHLEPLPQSLGQDDWLLLIGTSQLNKHFHEADYQTAIQWLKGLQNQFGLMAGICSGSLLAAKAGLLDGKRCTTHHDLTQALADVAPHALVQEDCIFVADGNIWTSAGITTGLDLCLQLVDNQWGQARSVQIAREMVIYMRRSGREAQLSFWLDHRNHTQSRVHAVQDMIMEQPGFDWDVTLLAEKVHLSERHLRRLFIKATGFNVQEYLQKARIELSRQLLEQTCLPIERVAERCGFQSERSYRRVWARWHEGTPSQFRRNYLVSIDS